MIRGEVHDENAFALGGASGHAGLFGTVDGVLDFARSVLDGSALSQQSLAALRTRESETRTIGWEAKHNGWSGGDRCSETTIGHTGFTGTGLWIDFERGLAWTLLTNRVHPTRHRETGIVALRRATGDRLMQATGVPEQPMTAEGRARSAAAGAFRRPVIRPPYSAPMVR